MTDFGRDTWCRDSLRSGRYATGVELVAQNAYHRLITPRGQLRGGEDEEDYGLDLVGMLGSVANPADAAALPGQIRAELLKDERILDVAATVTSSVGGPATEWIVEVTADTDEGPFDLVISVDGLTVELLKVTD